MVASLPQHLAKPPHVNVNAAHEGVLLCHDMTARYRGEHEGFQEAVA